MCIKLPRKCLRYRNYRSKKSYESDKFRHDVQTREASSAGLINLVSHMSILYRIKVRLASQVDVWQSCCIAVFTEKENSDKIYYRGRILYASLSNHIFPIGKYSGWLHAFVVSIHSYQQHIV